MLLDTQMTNSLDTSLSKEVSKRLFIYENVAGFCPTLPGPRFAGAEILVCLYEASYPVCQGGNGPRDIAFMSMAPVIGC